MNETNEIKRGSVWWANISFDECNPHVQYGRRPVVIVSNDKGNAASDAVVICPLTTRKDKYFFIHPFVKGSSKQSYVLCEQIRVVDKSVLQDYIRQLSDSEERAMDRALLFELGLSKYTQSNESELLKITPEGNYTVTDKGLEKKVSKEEQLGKHVLGMLDIIFEHFKPTQSAKCEDIKSVETNIPNPSKCASKPTNEMGWSEDKLRQFLCDYVHMSPRALIEKYELKSFKIATKYFNKYN